MFDLEKSIAEWRMQMLAAGIKTPVPLEELEIHLREEIERQMKSGLDEREAFNSARQKMGRARSLRAEFKKISRVQPFTRAHRYLGILLLTFCAFPGISFLAFLLWVCTSRPMVLLTLDFDLASLFCLLALAAAIMGVLLFRGVRWVRNVINLIAALSVIATIVWVVAFGLPSLLIFAFDFLLLVSLVLLEVERISTARI